MKNEEFITNEEHDHLTLETIRPLHEIIKAKDFLLNQVSYRYHMNRHFKIKLGEIQVLENATKQQHSQINTTVLRDRWEASLQAAKKLEDEFGVANLGPWEEFEWGMIHGKLSALRWMLGEEWDNLDSQM